MGLLIKLQNGDTVLKSLKFGNDRPGGASSGQPFIESPLGDPNNPSVLENDFLLRGGITAPLDAAEDSLRLTKYFSTPQGIAFITKQQLLSRSGVKTEATKGVSYGNGAINEGIYNPLGTIFQASEGYLGNHFNKQGLDPTGLFPDGNIITYQSALREQNAENYQQTNRLVKLFNLISTNTTNEENFNGVKNYNLNNPGEGVLISYSGGPGSAVGDGNTLIKFATDNGGIAPLKTLTSSSYLTGKPTDQIDQTLFKTPIGASNAYNGVSTQKISIYKDEANPDGLVLIQGNDSWEYNTLFSVYKSGSLEPNLEYISQLTQSQAIVSRNKDKAVYVSPINKIISSYGNQGGASRELLADPTYFEPSGSYLGVDPNGRILDTYSSENTLFNDNLNTKPSNTPKPHKKGYLANLDKNAGYYYDTQGNIVIQLQQYPRGIAPDFRLTPRNVRGFFDPPGYDKITDSSKEYFGNGAKTVDRIYYGNETQKRVSAPLGGSTDIIPFKITIVNPTSPTKTDVLNFRAYIDDFSETYSSEWTEQTYMGRPEKFYRYNGFDRNISLGFTIIAENKNNLKIMYNQLNRLAASMAPTYTSAGYMAGNLHQITLGNYLVNQYGVMTGLTYTTDLDTPWEISEGDQLPLYIKVSGISFNVIHNFRPESYFNKEHRYIDQTPKTNS